MNCETMMSIKPVAAHLNMSTRTVSRRVQAGELRAYKFGRNVRFDRADVEDYKKRMVVEPMANMKEMPPAPFARASILAMSYDAV